MGQWRRQKPSRSFWSDEDPSDPDFMVEFDLSPGDQVRLQAWWPILVAQRLFKKPPHLMVIPIDGLWRLRINVGLSELHMLAGQRLDPWLSKLVWIDVAPGVPGEDRLRLDAHAPLNLTLPTRMPGGETPRQRPPELPREPASLH